MNNDVEHFFNGFIGHLYILTLKCLLRPLSFLSAVLLGYLFFLTNLEKLFKKLCNFIKKKSSSDHMYYKYFSHSSLWNGSLIRTSPNSHSFKVCAFMCLTLWKNVHNQRFGKYGISKMFHCWKLHISIFDLLEIILGLSEIRSKIQLISFVNLKNLALFIEKTIISLRQVKKDYTIKQGLSQPRSDTHHMLFSRSSHMAQLAAMHQEQQMTYLWMLLLL